MMRAEEDALIVQSSKSKDWTDRAVQIAQTCNNLFAKNCAGACGIYYAESQVEFESRQEKVGPVGRAFAKNVTQNFEVAMYRQFLFDEDSVMEGVQVREEDEEVTHEEHNQKQPILDDNQTIVTQRTH